jgi:sulfhydrogenase subunit beta (sulfur reductase)
MNSLDSESIPFIAYNIPKPVTPLKNFFLPVKENVTQSSSTPKKRIIIGAPNCDLEALKILDEIYLDNDYTDRFYLNKRNNTLLITSDCFGVQEHCHCTTYGVNPYTEGNGDISIAVINDHVLLSVFSEKGESFVREFNIAREIVEPDSPIFMELCQKRMETVRTIEKSTKHYLIIIQPENW